MSDGSTLSVGKGHQAPRDQSGSGIDTYAEQAPLVVIRDLRLGYTREEGETTVAIDGVSFKVSSEERLMILGPSGCGKSTLLRGIAGFKRPFAGEITVAGKPVERPGPDRAMVFQEFDQLLPWRKVLHNVTFPLRLNGSGKREALEKAHDFLEIMGLAASAERYPHELSGGMKQRVAIARGLALSPVVLLMDEPFGALDAFTRSRLQDELKRIAEQQKTTIIFVTHSIREALILGHRVVVLTGSPGRVAEIVQVPENLTEAPEEMKSLEDRLHSLLGESG